MNDLPPGVLIGIAPNPDPEADETTVPAFGRAGPAPAWTLATRSWAVGFWGLECASVGSDPSGRIVSVVHGDLWEGGADPAGALARWYDERGPGFAVDVRGSWTGLVVDRTRDTVILFTDRTNSRRLFHRPDGGVHWIATHLAAMPARDLAPDPVAVAWYLSNGVVHCRRTPLAGVSVLEGGSAHAAEPGGLVSRRYWRFPYQAGDEKPTVEEAGQGLLERIRAAVRRCAATDGETWLSLSGGYDSTAIAGVLREMGVAGVRSLSYTLGPPEAGSDAAVADAMLPMLGFRHRRLESYAGDFMAHVEANAAMGEGMANACDELDAWIEAGRELGGSAPPLLVGDHFLPANPERAELSEAAPAGKLRGPESVPWLLPLLEGPMSRAMEEGVPADIDRAMAGHDPDLVRGPMFFEHRLPNVLLAWRHAFAGRFFRVRNPLLDNDILDYVASLHADVRRSSYYHGTVTATYPDLFGVPRATSAGYYMSLNAEIDRHRERIRRRLLATVSPLDDLLPPRVGLDVLERVQTGRSTRERLAARLGGAFRPRDGAGRADGSEPGVKRVSEGRLLRRYLILREALARMAG